MAQDPTSAGMRTEYTSPESDEIRIVLPIPDYKGTSVAKPPAFNSDHVLPRFPDHKLVELRSGANGTVEQIYEDLPTTPRVAEEIDAAMGIVWKHTYRDKLSATLPTIGATSLLGTALSSGRYIYRAQEQPVGGIVAEVTAISVLPPGPLRTTRMTDAGFASVYKYEQFVLSTTSVPAIGATYNGIKVKEARLVDDDGTFATLEVTGPLSLPGTLKRTKLTSPEFGVVYQYTRAVASNTDLPAIGDAFEDIEVKQARLVDDDGYFGTLEVTGPLVVPGLLKQSKLTDKDYGTIFRYEQVVNVAVTSLPAIGASYQGKKVLRAQLINEDGTFATLQIDCSTTLSGTEKQGTEIDKIFCNSKTYRQQVEASAVSLPSRGDSFTSPSGLTSGYVLDAKLENDDGVNATLVLTLSTTNSVSISEYDFDPGTGQSIEVVSLYSIGASPPTASGADENGRYSTVQRLDCNYWIKKTDSVRGIRIGEGNALNYLTTGRILWPAVLESYEFFKVAQNFDLTYATNKWSDVFAFNMRDPYAGDVKVRVRQWWQNSAYTVPEPPQMIPSSIRIEGHLKTISIPECLHGEFQYKENNILATVSGFNITAVENSLLVFTVSETDLKDWPSEITKIDQKFSNGGYIVTEETYYRPTNYDKSTTTITRESWYYGFGLYYNYP